MNLLKKNIFTASIIFLIIFLPISIIGCPYLKQLLVEETKIEEMTVSEEEMEVEETTPVLEEGPVTLMLNVGKEPETADPAFVTDTTSLQLVESIFLGLTGLDKDSNVITELATEWEPSNDGLTWTFSIRDDITWVRYNCSTNQVEQVLDEYGNPIPVTANDVVYGVRRTLNPVTGSDYAYVLYVLKNGEAVNTTEEEIIPELLETIGVEAVDDYTVKFTLEHKAPYFPGIVSMSICKPLPQEVIEYRKEKWIEPCYIYSNGPYVMTEWVHGNHYTLVKNPYYPDADKIQIEKIIAYMVEDEYSAFNMYKNNQLDICNVPISEINKIKSDKVLKEELTIIPVPNTYYYGFTNNKPPFDNHLIRKAFSAAIDRQTLIDTVLDGKHIPANSFAPPGIFGNVAGDPDVGITYDPEKAKAYLTEAGYLDGEGFPEVILMHNESEHHKKIAEAIVVMWKEVLNVDVKIETQELMEYLKTLQKDTPLEDMPHIWRLFWFADYPDQNNWVHEVFNNTAGVNRLRRGCLDPTCTEVEELEFDKLTREAGIEQDPKKRKELYKQAEYQLNNIETAIVPIYFNTIVTLTKPWVNCTIKTVGQQDFYLWNIDMDTKRKIIEE